MSTFAIIIERGETGSFGAWSPDLPGCVAVADDQRECLRLMEEAVGFQLEGLRAAGEGVPRNSCRSDRSPEEIRASDLRRELRQV